MAKKIIPLALALLLSGCLSGVDHADLHEFMEQARNVPGGRIEPPPTFKPYEPFVYSAAGMRSPFDRPASEVRQLFSGQRSDVKPDFNRVKEPLEFVDINTLIMVGTIERNGELWALIDDQDGGIHRVRKGNYLGKNHGKVVSASKEKIEIIEIVSDGRDGWLERPKTLTLIGLEN